MSTPVRPGAGGFTIGRMALDDRPRTTDPDAAPDPEAEGKPDSPTEVTPRSWKYVLRKTVREFTADECTDIAAALTYYAVLALFPALLAVFSVLGVIGQGEEAVGAITGIVQQTAPDAAEAVEGVLEGFADSPAAGFGLIVGVVLAVWSASGFVRAFSRGMNRIYEIREGRPFWKLVPALLGVTVIGIALVSLAVLVLVIGGPVAESIGAALGWGATFVVVWEFLRWIVLAAIVVLMVAILYYATPNARQPKFRWMSLGAFLAILVLAAASLLFGLYVANFSNYDRTYGALAGVIIFLLWLWIANIALLFGAEFDAELERGRQLQAGIAAEEDIQLPPRDTRKSDKADEKERADIEEGRRIRVAHGDGGGPDEGDDEATR